MNKPVLRIAQVCQKAQRMFVLAPVIAAVVVALLPATANAEANGYSGRNLPGGSWTTGNGVFLSGEDFISASVPTTSSICVGPVTYNGTYQAPYGWKCEHPYSVSWSFSPITAAAGLYNPNPGTFTSFEVYAHN